MVNKKHYLQGFQKISQLVGRISKPSTVGFKKPIQIPLGGLQACMVVGEECR